MAKSFKDMVIPLKGLKTDDYQRPLNAGFVLKKVKNFDVSQVRQLTISERDNGDRYIVDGNHTVHILLEVYGKDATAMARVFYGLTYEEEAEMFNQLNSNSRRPTSNQRIKAQYLARDPEMVEYFESLERNAIPYTINQSERGKLQCHTATIRLKRLYGLDLLIKSLLIIKDVYGPTEDRLGEPSAYNLAVIEGVDILLHTFGDSCKVDTLKIALRSLTPEEIWQSIRNGGNKDIRPAIYIAKAYNKVKRCKKLDIDRIGEVKN